MPEDTKTFPIRICGSCAAMHYGVTRAHAVAMAHQSGDPVDKYERCSNCGGTFRDFVSVVADYQPSRATAIASPIIVE